MKREALLFCLGGLLFFYASAFGNRPGSNIKFETNKGQWPSGVYFKTDISNGRVFFANNDFTYVYYANASTPSDRLKCHAYKAKFIGSSNFAEVIGENIQTERHNYFKGNDSRTWVHNINVYGKIRYKNLYPFVDMIVYGQGENLKYDFVLQKGADVRKLKIQYDGVTTCLLNGNLIIQTSLNKIVEEKPYAYQIVSGNKVSIPCEFKLKNNIVSFYIANYDPSATLVIDPIVIASTYSGSNATNYASCATFDKYGNIYGGAMCEGIGFPVSTGAFDVSYNGIQDIVINKMNADGTSLIYATYLGGDNYEAIQSMFVNKSNELCLLGSTMSNNFPVSLGCYDNIFNGGSFDLFVTNLDSSGSNLIGSTYIGGSNNDGNYDTSFVLNHAIERIGELIVDSLGLIYVTSSSKSLDFPITSGAQGNDGGEDVVAFILSSDCSSLLWSTCVGGTGDETGTGLRISASGELVITGRTNSSDFPATGSAYMSSYQGGSYDGFVCKISPGTNSISASTYYGTASDDRACFVDIDKDDNIYILGQTRGNIISTPGTYGNPGSSNYVCKLNASLSSVFFQTVIGNGGGFSLTSQLRPTAFFVDTCENIYFSGFNPHLTFFSGYPQTSNAINVVTSRVGYFYLAELASNASFLKVGTLFNGSECFVGHGRFDKYGTLYQAISATGSNQVPSTTNAYCQWIPAANDMVLVKVDFQSSVAHANAIVNPGDSGCAPFAAQFYSINSHGRNFIWDFGDGTPIDTSLNPLHTFIDTGTFRVQLIVIDSTSCQVSDTFHLNVYIKPGLTHQPLVDTILCNTSSIILQAHELSTNNNYVWNNGAITDTITVTSPDTFWVNISNGLCSVMDSFAVDKLSIPYLGPDTNLCEGLILNLYAPTNADNYSWSTGDTTSSININQSNTYWVDVTKQDCVLRDSILINFDSTPQVNLGNDIVICPNASPNVILDVGIDNSSFSKIWSTGDTTKTISVSASGQYWVTVRNGQCSGSDSIVLSNAQTMIMPHQSSFFCSYDEAWLDAQVKNVIYLWNTGDTTRRIHVKEPGMYWFQINYNGCTESDTLEASGPFADNQIWFPSAFTPNGDGKNDIFIPIGTDIQQFKMDIFDRWGKRIFSSVDFINGWDGKMDGTAVQPGMYTYQIEYTTSCSNYPINKTGVFLLLQ